MFFQPIPELHGHTSFNHSVSTYLNSTTHATRDG